jgi:putative heme-binding domain-containing protein
MRRIRLASLLFILTATARSQTEHEPGSVVSSIPLLPVAPTPEELATGQRLFQAHCAACHGPGGEGGKGPTLAQPVLPRASTDEALIKIISSGISDTEMPRSRLERAEIRLVALHVRVLGRRPIEQVPGDPVRGAQIFATKGDCAQCHSLGGYGGTIGPELTYIGRQRSAAYLRRALTEPAAEVPQSFTAFRGETGIPDNFLFVRIVTRDGITVAGVRVNEDAFSVQLRDLAGKLHSFFKSDLTELHKDWRFSPMPSYATAFTKDELDDLVAFLVSQQGKK